MHSPTADLLLPIAARHCSEIPSTATPRPLDELCRAIACQLSDGEADPYQVAYAAIQTRVTMGSIGCADIGVCARTMVLAMGIEAARQEQPAPALEGRIHRALESARLGIEAADRLFKEIGR